METTLSDKFRVASFVAAVLVVLRHAHNLPAFFPMGGEPSWLNGLEWGTIFWTDVAVPFFFFSSGYFFMRKDYFQERSYFAMLRKKVRSLFIPFVIWNLVGVCFLFVSDKEGNMGATWQEWVHNFLYSKWYGPMWFVRDLMVLMLCFPLYGWMYRRRVQWMVVVVILYLMYFRWWPASVYFLSAEGMIFFALGGLLQKHRHLLSYRIPVWMNIMMFALWVFVSFKYTSFDRDWHRLSLLIGMPAFWYAIDLLPSRLWHFCKQMAKYSFLIYVTHFYTLKVLKVGTAYFLENNAWIALSSFVVLPAILLPILIGGGRVWQQVSPRSYSICMGGRSV